MDTLIDLAVAQARRGRRSVIYLTDPVERDRCRSRLRRSHPKEKKLIRISNIAGNDLVLQQAHEQARVRRETAAAKSLTSRESAQVD